MKIALEEYEAIRRASVQATAARERAVGAFESLRAELKREWGCSNLKEARALLARMEEKQAQLESNLATRLDLFERKWSHLIQES